MIGTKRSQANRPPRPAGIRRAGLVTVLATLIAAAMPISVPLAAEGIAGEVVRIDQSTHCLWLDWNNNTEKIVCWTEVTKFSVLETEKAASPSDVRSGSYVRLEGEERDGKYWASEIVIWEGASKPPPAAADAAPGTEAKKE